MPKQSLDNCQDERRSCDGHHSPKQRSPSMTNLDLTGRTALVTGGAQGLGEGMAQALAASRRARRGRRPAERPRREGGRARSRATVHGFVHLDVTNEASWENAVDRGRLRLRRARHPGQQRRRRDHQPDHRGRPEGPPKATATPAPRPLSTVRRVAFQSPSLLRFVISNSPFRIGVPCCIKPSAAPRWPSPSHPPRSGCAARPGTG